MDDVEAGSATPHPPAKRRRLSWLAYLIGVLTPVAPVMLGIGYEQLSEPSREVVAASQLLGQLSPGVEAYRSQSDLLHVRARRVATVMLRGGSPTDVDDRYDDFLLIWSDYQTTWSDLLLLIEQDGGSRPELMKLHGYIKASANVASNRIDRCLLAANDTYDEDARLVMVNRARADSATPPDSSGEDRRPRLTCPRGASSYFLMDDQLSRLGSCNYRIRRVLVTTVADLRRARDAGPLAKLGRRVSRAVQGPGKGSIQPDYWRPLMNDVETACSEAALTPRPARLTANQTLYPWQGRAPLATPALEASRLAAPPPAGGPGPAGAAPGATPAPILAAPPEKKAAPPFF